MVSPPTTTRAGPSRRPSPLRNLPPAASKRFTAAASFQLSVASSRMRPATGAQLGVESCGSLPAGRLHAHALGEEGDEDPGFLVAEARQVLEVAEQLVSVGCPFPDRLGPAVVVLDECPAEVAGAVGHRPREA